METLVAGYDGNQMSLPIMHSAITLHEQMQYCNHVVNHVLFIFTNKLPTFVMSEQLLKRKGFMVIWQEK